MNVAVIPNQMLGSSKENIETLHKAISYLEIHK